MKPRMLLVGIILLFSALACNMPGADTTPTTTGTPTGSLDVLTLAAATANAGQTPAAPLTTPLPTSAQAAATTPAEPTATRLPPTSTTQPCDQAQFIQDVTVPDGTKLPAGTAFTKTWRLRNLGTCTWNTSYAMVFAGGDAMGAPAVINLPGNVPPNSTVDLSIEMKAPAKPGKYESNWKLRNSTGVVFGVFDNQPFFVQLEVTSPTPSVTPSPTVTSTLATGMVYDLVSSMCSAEWRSQAGNLVCPGAAGSSSGYVMRAQNPQLETGTTESNPVLLTVPDSSPTGAITGRYPAVTIQQGYHFLAVLGCQAGANNCSVTYQVNYIAGSAQPVNLGQWTHTYNGSVQGIDIDLSPLAGQSVQIVLAVVAGDSADQDQAMWVFPRIVKK